MRSKHHMHPMHGTHYAPCNLALFTATMAVGTVVSLWLTSRIVHALELMAMAKALDNLDTRLSDPEKAELEASIRERLFV